MIRRFSLILFFSLCLPLPALATLTLGTVLQKDTLIPIELQAIQFASALQVQLDEEVIIRIFPDEKTLHTWLNRYQQVDIAAFSRTYVQNQPAGEFFQLRGTTAFGSLAPLVLRQGVSQRLRQRIQTAVSRLAADPATRSIFQKPTVATAPQAAPAPRPPSTQPAPPAMVAADAVPEATLAAAAPAQVLAKMPPEVSNPLTSSASDLPRIGLEQEQTPPPAEEEEISVALEAVAERLPETTAAARPEGLDSEAFRDRTNPIESPPALPRATGAGTGKSYAGSALAVLAVTGGFVLLGRKRRSASHRVTLTPRLHQELAPPPLPTVGIRIRDDQPKAAPPPPPTLSEIPEQVDTRAPLMMESPAREECSDSHAAPKNENHEVPLAAIQNQARFIERITADPAMLVADGELAAASSAIEENWRNEELEPERFDAGDRLAEGPADLLVAEPEKSVATAEEIPETTLAVEDAVFDENWDADEFAPISLEPAEEPFTGPLEEGRDAAGIQEPETFPAPETEDNRPPAPFSLSVDGNELESFSFDREPSMPLAEAPDYRSFFQAEATPEPIEPSPASAGRSNPGRHGQPVERTACRSDRPMALRMMGELGPAQVPALLKLISGQKKAGTLLVRSEQDEKYIYFCGGKIAAATVNRSWKLNEPDGSGKQFGDLLVEQGLISEPARDRALEICARQPSRSIDEVLVETGQVSYQDLRTTRRAQIEEILFSLILFPKGNFEYLTEKSPIPAGRNLAIDISELLKEAADQAVEWRELRKVIPSLDTVLEFKENHRKKLQNARMTSRQELILEQVDGKRTIQEICRRTGMLELEVYKFLCLMTKARFISPAGKGKGAA